MRYRSIYTLFGVLLCTALLSSNPNTPCGINTSDHVITSSFTGILAGNNNPLGLDFTKGKSITCFGASDGEMTAEAFNGLPPYTFSWSDGQTGPTATGLSAGTYTVTVTDSNGDTFQRDITFSQPTEVILNVVSETYLTCINPATFTVSANGGTPGYTYLWSTGTSGPYVALNNPNTVTVEVTDKNGCMKNLDLTPGLDVAPPISSATGGTLTCLHPLLNLEVQAESPCGAFTYEWTDPNGNIFSNSYSPAVVSPDICLDYCKWNH
ncbi:MAG: SprB repeat-containing protein [Saprospiraceae bacterium]|nr:SprB repeat-containing protein [Saprospiraceae bacterium]